MSKASGSPKAADEGPAHENEEDKVPCLARKKEDKGRYLVKRELGRGSFGIVYLVERRTDSAVVVAKLMDLSQMSARDREYAYSEIRCMASCDHPNCIKFYEDAEEDGQLIIIMGFADAGDLDRQIKSRATDSKRYFQEHEVLFLFMQMALAMQHIHHTKHMMHRDLKPANIMLNSNGLAAVADFGFSHQYESTVSGNVANTYLGTPYYMSPELWNNKRYSSKADVWALGVMLFEMAALTRPFSAGSMKALHQRITSGGPPAKLPDKYSNELNELIRAILIVDPAKRPSMNDIFCIPYMRKGLASFMETIERNAKIADEIKRAFALQVAQIESMANARSGVVAAAPRSPKGGDGTGGAPGAEQAQHGEINKNVAFEGIVYKLGPTAAGSQWKEKYLVLARGYLILCDKKGEEKQGKALNLTSVVSVVPVPKLNAKRGAVLSLNTTSGKSMWLQAPSQQEMEDWIANIHRALGI